MSIKNTSYIVEFWRGKNIDYINNSVEPANCSKGKIGLFKSDQNLIFQI